MYKKRFKIEKTFQELTSSGFDIENLKIKKSDRFKKWQFAPQNDNIDLSSYFK